MLRLEKVKAVAKAEVSKLFENKISASFNVFIGLVTLLILSGYLAPLESASSTPKIYSVAYCMESGFSDFLKKDAYINLVYYDSCPRMGVDVYKSRLENSLIDCAMLENVNYIYLFSNGSRKAASTMEKMKKSAEKYNAYLMQEYAKKNPENEGTVFPIRVKIEEREADIGKLLVTSQNAASARQPSAPKIGQEKEQRLISSIGKETATEDANRQAAGQSAYVPAKAGTGLNALSQEQGTEGVPLMLPSEITIDFPFKRIMQYMFMVMPFFLICFLFILSLSTEKITKSISNLLSSPLSGTEIAIGKSLPYAAALAAFSLVYGIMLSKGIMGALAVAYIFFSIAALMLAFSLVAALASRSYREITFITSLFAFAFFLIFLLPNIFLGINSLAFLSPLTLIALIESGAKVGLSEIFSSLLPYHYLTLSFFALGIFSLKSELIVFSFTDLRGLAFSFMDSIKKIAKNRHAFVFITVFSLVPAAFVAENMLGYMVIPISVFAASLAAVSFALVEETIKAMPFYSLPREKKSIGASFAYAFVAGTAFFLGEKVFVIPVIMKIYSLFGNVFFIFVAKDLLITYGVHIACSLLFVLMAGFAPKHGKLAIAAAASAHAAYNLYIMGAVG